MRRLLAKVLRYFRPDFREEHFLVCQAFCLLLQVVTAFEWAAFSLGNSHWLASQSELVGFLFGIPMISALFAFPLWSLFAAGAMAWRCPGRRWLRFGEAGLALVSVGVTLSVLTMLVFRLPPLSSSLSDVVGPIWWFSNLALMPSLFLLDIVLTVRSRRSVSAQSAI